MSVYVQRDRVAELETKLGRSLPARARSMVEPTIVDQYDLDGIPWHEAPVPRWLHRCYAQTYAYEGLSYVERCACGAIRGCGPRYPHRTSYWFEHGTAPTMWSGAPAAASECRGFRGWLESNSRKR